MPLSKALSFFVFSCTFDRSMCVEPLAALAVQPVWQAGEPMAVNVDYDVPAFGPQDAALKLQLVSNIDRGFPARIVQSNFVPDHDQHGPSSFLATRVLPVDADRIKKSLYLTQSMRSPPQASVNVIMREDVQGMQDASKYQGMVDQTRALQNEFRQNLAAMSSGEQ
jgi:hypothetical protein